MLTPHRTWKVAIGIGIVVFMLACMAPGLFTRAAQQTVTPKPLLADTAAPLGSPTLTAAPVHNSSTGGNNVNSNGSNSSGNNGNSGSNSADQTGDKDSANKSDQPTPTQTPPDRVPLPYVVKQIETLGGEVISGSVCSLTKPFSVLSVTPHATFNFNFAPQNENHGNVSYTYSIPKAGETHDASGTYSLVEIDKAGTLQLTLVVSDHVVFKGFDGNIPNTYKFNLVPSVDVVCP